MNVLILAKLIIAYLQDIVNNNTKNRPILAYFIYLLPYKDYFQTFSKVTFKVLGTISNSTICHFLEAD